MVSTAHSERTLLLLAGLMLLVGTLAIGLANGKIDYGKLVVVAGVIIGWQLIAFILRLTGHHGDQLLLPLAAVPASLGLIMVLRLKPALFATQALWLAIGLAAFLFAAVIFRRVKEWAEYKYVWGVIGVVLLLSTAVFGVDIGGHKDWIIFGPVSVQPAEFAKLFIVLFLAAFLNERREILTYATKTFGPLVLPHPRFIAPLLAVWGLAMLTIVYERDMGAALLFFGTAITMVYLASGRWSYIILGGALFPLGALAAYAMFAHVRVRVDIWLNPWSDPTGKAYQVVQSLFAFGSGGTLGTGLTYGFPDIIPEVHTDFIFAAIGEELGLVGTGAVMLIFMLLIQRGFRAATRAADPFNMLLAAGLSVQLALQIFVIIGGVTKFLPLTGVTLPFVSYGGSSMISTFILLGMIYAISEAGADDA